MLSLLLGTGSAVARELETQAIKDRLASIESYLQEDRLRSAKVAIASAQEGLSIIQHSTGMREMNLVSLATHLRAAYIDIQGAIYQTKIQSRFFGLSKKIVPYLERTNRLRCALMLGAINQLEHAIYETLGDDGLLMQLAEKREKNADAIDEVTKDNLRVDLWNNSLSEIENLSGRERLECVKKKAGAWQKKDEALWDFLIELWEFDLSHVGLNFIDFTDDRGTTWFMQLIITPDGKEFLKRQVCDTAGKARIGTGL